MDARNTVGGIRAGVGVDFRAEVGELLPLAMGCGPTQHDFTDSDASANPDVQVPVLFCRQCGEIRKLQAPA